MAFIQCDFYSEILGTRTSLNAVIPLRDESGQEHPREMPEQYPVMFLLHGLHSNYSAWSRYSSVERYANERGLAVVMPDAGRSFYTNMRYGYRYFDFFSQELPEVANCLFPLSRDRSQRFIAGLSMGGYGAFKLALSHPEQYAAAASLSGALSLTEIEDPESLLPEWPIIFGDNSKIEHSENDLLNLARRYHERQPFPFTPFPMLRDRGLSLPIQSTFSQERKRAGVGSSLRGEFRWPRMAVLGRTNKESYRMASH